ncbi:hypothetical protein NLU13_4842 [Sarocladium strictum]|uniref:Aquaporin-1 n=1 Tax=Sarocladium strictum TaxID=5046 RepID=A0AA39GLD1_SARSR|nr:hypothetical protein NLU13_4842 [Sarocladium strictum]
MKNPLRRSGNGHNGTSDSVRNTFTVVLGEFCGTFLFLLLSYLGTQIAFDTTGFPDVPLQPIALIYVALSFGSALTVTVWIFYRITGGMFNPAITLALLLAGVVKPARAPLIIITQLVAAIAAAGVTNGLLPGPLLSRTTLASNMSVTRGLFLEMFLTAQLVLTVFFLAVEKHRGTFLAPIGIGVSLFIAMLCGVNYTGASVNPARSFGPAVVAGFEGYHWIYWVGPGLGALLAFAVYGLFRKLGYWTANPDQDAPDVEKADNTASNSR